MNLNLPFMNKHILIFIVAILCIAAQGAFALDAQSEASSSTGQEYEHAACEQPPQLNSTPPPIYPEAARAECIDGRVFVRVLIDEQGRAVRCEIVKRVPQDSTVFDTEATRIAMKSTYTPGIQNGKPVRVWMTFPIRFSFD